MNADVDLIGTVIADYSLGRHRGFTDDETQERAERALNWLVEEVESLQAQLAESQRREKAAVEDMRKLKCFICKKYKISCWPYCNHTLTAFVNFNSSEFYAGDMA